MFKVGDRVKIEVSHKILYGIVVAKDGLWNAVSIAIGEDRVIQARECDVEYDEGYAKLKQERYNG